MASPLDVFRDDALAGHVALITGGGTGVCRGIANAVAQALAKFGALDSVINGAAGNFLAPAAGLSPSGSPRLGMMS